MTARHDDLPPPVPPRCHFELSAERMMGALGPPPPCATRSSKRRRAASRDSERGPGWSSRAGRATVLSCRHRSPGADLRRPVLRACCVACGAPGRTRGRGKQSVRPACVVRAGVTRAHLSSLPAARRQAGHTGCACPCRGGSSDRHLHDAVRGDAAPAALPQNGAPIDNRRPRWMGPRNVASALAIMARAGHPLRTARRARSGHRRWSGRSRRCGTGSPTAASSRCRLGSSPSRAGGRTTR